MSVDDLLKVFNRVENVKEAYILVHEFVMRLDYGVDFKFPKITIRIYKDRDLVDCPYVYELSHFAHTPTQGSPYSHGRDHFETIEETLYWAITAITEYVDEAVDAGKEIEEDWLIENENFYSQ